ncbi:MAG TPA: hypothetical protein VF476_00330 [Chitinophagaceae bacterium]
MQRRGFIKKFIGNDIRNILFWAVALLTLIVILKIDFTQIGNSIGSVVQMVLIILGVLVGLTLIFLAVKWVVEKIVAFLPVKLVGWLERYGKIILNTIATVILLYLFYVAFRKENYSLIIFIVIYSVISLLFRERPEADKS